MVSRQEVMAAIESPNEDFLRWSSGQGLCADLAQNRVCECGHTMVAHFHESCPDGGVFRCTNWQCSRTLSVRTDHWTWNMRLSLKQIAFLMVCWIDRRPIRLTVTDTGVCQRTVSQYFDFFRELAERAYRCDLVKNPLGSTGGVVQIDESLFNRAKYNRGSALARPKMWFFGAVDSETNRLAIEVCEDRSRDTLEAMISGMVAPGAEIWSDSWRGYARLDNAGFAHSVVNHSVNYRDPETGVHTNRIEGNWGAVKNFLRQMHCKCRAKTELYVHEYCFRRNLGTSFGDCWRLIIETQRTTRPDWPA